MAFILKNRRLNYDDKVKMKNLGGPTPMLDIKKLVRAKVNKLIVNIRKKMYLRNFRGYAVVPIRKKKAVLFRFPFNQQFASFTVDDLQHLQESTTKHGNSDAKLFLCVSPLK